jgi:sugar phosphate isomerase/epimerase
MKLACQEHLIPGDTLIAKWEFISSVGYDGIELRGQGDLQFRERLPELREARRAGVVMPSVCVIMDHFIGDFDADRRRDAVENMKSLLSVIAEVGGAGAITPAAYGLFSRRLPPFEPPRPPEGDRQVLLEGLGELGELAAREGVRVLFEPLNRYEDHMVNTLAAGAELCQAVGLDSVKVMGDFFHMSIEEADLAESIRQAGGYLAHMHLADSNRKQPGLGHTDFRPALQALMQIGFDGYMALECHLSGEPRAALAETARYLRSMLPAAPAA